MGLFWTPVGGGVGRCQNCRGTDWIANFQSEGRCRHCGSSAHALLTVSYDPDLINPERLAELLRDVEGVKYAWLRSR